MNLNETILSLRSAGKDNARIEVKSTTKHIGKSIWETVSAFSNSRGGTIILGLDEKNGFKSSPDFSAERTIDQIKAGLRGNDSKVSPEPIVTELDAVSFEGNELVIMEIGELSPEAKPCFVKAQGKENGSYERLSDGDHRLGSHAVYLLSSQSVTSRDDHEPATDATVEDLDEVIVRKLIDRVRVRRPRALDGTTSDIEVLRRLQVVAPKSSHPTLAGLLALGRFPQQFYSQLMISFAHYPGNSKSDVANGSGFSDVAVIEGSIPDMIDDAVSAVLRNLKHRRVIKGAGAEERPEIPVEAIREAIANAVTHRDYSPYAQGDQVRVELYSDRLEIHSPGGIWGRRIESITNGTSRSRNQILAKLLTDVEFRNRPESVCENQGSGVPRMMGVMQHDGLPSPEFRSTVTEFTVVLSRHGIMNPDVRKWLETLPGERSNLQDQTLALLLHLGPLDVDHLRRQLGIDTFDQLKALNDLEQRGLIRRDARLGTFELFDSSNTGLTELEQQILETLTAQSPIKLAEIAEKLGKKPSSLRAAMRALVAQGRVTATAPPSSRNRAYLLPEK